MPSTVLVNYINSCIILVIQADWARALNLSSSPSTLALPPPLPPPAAAAALPPPPPPPGSAAPPFSCVGGFAVRPHRCGLWLNGSTSTSVSNFEKNWEKKSFCTTRRQVKSFMFVARTLFSPPLPRAFQHQQGLKTIQGFDVLTPPTPSLFFLFQIIFYNVFFFISLVGSLYFSSGLATANHQSCLLLFGLWRWWLWLVQRVQLLQFWLVRFQLYLGCRGKESKQNKSCAIF